MTNLEIGLMAACISLTALVGMVIIARTAPSDSSPDEHASDDNLGI